MRWLGCGVIKQVSERTLGFEFPNQSSQSGQAHDTYIAPLCLPFVNVPEALYERQERFWSDMHVPPRLLEIGLHGTAEDSVGELVVGGLERCLTCKRAHTYACSQEITFLPQRVRTHAHARAWTWTLSSTHAHTRTHAHGHEHTLKHACACAHTRTHIQTLHRCWMRPCTWAMACNKRSASGPLARSPCSRRRPTPRSASSGQGRNQLM